METLRKFGPYVAIEVLLPGGTLIALLLYISDGHVDPARCRSTIEHGKGVDAC
jgi:hypothetical protein